MNKGIKELHNDLINKTISPEELIRDSIKSCHDIQEKTNAFVTIIDEANSNELTDDILSNVQSILSTGLQNFGAAQERLMTDMDDSLNVVVQSRKELAGQDQTPTYEETEEPTVDLED